MLATTHAAGSAITEISGAHDVLIVVVYVAAAALLAAAIVRYGRLGAGGNQVTAAVRATLQLAGVGLIIGLVLRSWPATIAFCAAMLLVAGLTAGRRITRSWSPWAIPSVLTALLGLGCLLLTGLVPLEPVSVIPVLGILIGGAMTATSLSGRRMNDALQSQWATYEGALALGISERTSRDVVVRDSAALALIPGLDQTRTVGIVTLPGAFVGALLGGATALEAAALQLLVLVTLLGVQAAAVLTTVLGFVRGHLDQATA